MNGVKWKMKFEFEELEKINTFMQMAFDENSITQEKCLEEIQNVITHKKKRKRSEAWSCLKNMPPLYHKLPGHGFSYEQSEVLKWLGEQKEPMDWLLRSAYQNNYVIYDKETGKWQGVDYERISESNDR